MSGQPCGSPPLLLALLIAALAAAPAAAATTADDEPPASTAPPAQPAAGQVSDDDDLSHLQPAAGPGVLGVAHAGGEDAADVKDDDGGDDDDSDSAGSGTISEARRHPPSIAAPHALTPTPSWSAVASALSSAAAAQLTAQPAHAAPPAHYSEHATPAVTPSMHYAAPAVYQYAAAEAAAAEPYAQYAAPAVPPAASSLQYAAPAAVPAASPVQYAAPAVPPVPPSLQYAAPAAAPVAPSVSYAAPNALPAAPADAPPSTAAAAAEAVQAHQTTAPLSTYGAPAASSAASAASAAAPSMKCPFETTGYYDASPATPSASYGAPAAAPMAPSVSYAAPAAAPVAPSVSYATPTAAPLAPSVNYGAPAAAPMAPSVSYAPSAAAPVTPSVSYAAPAAAPVSPSVSYAAPAALSAAAADAPPLTAAAAAEAAQAQQPTSILSSYGAPSAPSAASAAAPAPVFETVPHQQLAAAHPQALAAATPPPAPMAAPSAPAPPCPWASASSSASAGPSAPLAAPAPPPWEPWPTSAAPAAPAAHAAHAAPAAPAAALSAAPAAPSPCAAYRAFLASSSSASLQTPRSAPAPPPPPAPTPTLHPAAARQPLCPAFAAFAASSATSMAQPGPQPLSQVMPQQMPQLAPQPASQPAPQPMPQAASQPMSLTAPQSVSPSPPGATAQSQPWLQQMPQPLPQQMPLPLPQQMPQPLPQQMPQPLPQPLPQQMPQPLPQQMPQQMPQPLPQQMAEVMALAPSTGPSALPASYYVFPSSPYSNLPPAAQHAHPALAAPRASAAAASAALSNRDWAATESWGWKGSPNLPATSQQRMKTLFPSWDKYYSMFGELSELHSPYVKDGEDIVEDGGEEARVHEPRGKTSKRKTALQRYKDYKEHLLDGDTVPESTELVQPVSVVVVGGAPPRRKRRQGAAASNATSSAPSAAPSTTPSSASPSTSSEELSEDSLTTTTMQPSEAEQGMATTTETEDDEPGPVSVTTVTPTASEETTEELESLIETTTVDPVVGLGVSGDVQKLDRADQGGGLGADGDVRKLDSADQGGGLGADGDVRKLDSADQGGGLGADGDVRKLDSADQGGGLGADGDVRKLDSADQGGGLGADGDVRKLDSADQGGGLGANGDVRKLDSADQGDRKTRGRGATTARMSVKEGQGARDPPSPAAGRGGRDALAQASHGVVLLQRAGSPDAGPPRTAVASARSVPPHLRLPANLPPHELTRLVDQDFRDEADEDKQEMDELAQEDAKEDEELDNDHVGEDNDDHGTKRPISDDSAEPAPPSEDGRDTNKPSDQEEYVSDLENPPEPPTRPNYTHQGMWAKPPADLGLDFIPVQTFAQVRRYETVSHLTPEDAMAEASNEEEYFNAPRLREIVSHRKISEVYSEEGYEDAGYDHGGFNREGEHIEVVPAFESTALLVKVPKPKSADGDDAADPDGDETDEDSEREASQLRAKKLVPNVADAPERNRTKHGGKKVTQGSWAVTQVVSDGSDQSVVLKEGGNITRPTTNRAAWGPHEAMSPPVSKDNMAAASGSTKGPAQSSQTETANSDKATNSTTAVQLTTLAPAREHTQLPQRVSQTQAPQLPRDLPAAQLPQRPSQGAKTHHRTSLPTQPPIRAASEARPPQRDSPAAQPPQRDSSPSLQRDVPTTPLPPKAPRPPSLQRVFHAAQPHQQAPRAAQPPQRNLQGTQPSQRPLQPATPHQKLAPAAQQPQRVLPSKQLPHKAPPTAPSTLTQVIPQHPVLSSQPRSRSSSSAAPPLSIRTVSATHPRAAQPHQPLAAPPPRPPSLRQQSPPPHLAPTSQPPRPQPPLRKKPKKPKKKTKKVSKTRSHLLGFKYPAERKKRRKTGKPNNSPLAKARRKHKLKELAKRRRKLAKLRAERTKRRKLKAKAQSRTKDAAASKTSSFVTNVTGSGRNSNRKQTDGPSGRETPTTNPRGDMTHHPAAFSQKLMEKLRQVSDAHWQGTAPPMTLMRRSSRTQRTPSRSTSGSSSLSTNAQRSASSPIAVPSWPVERSVVRTREEVVHTVTTRSRPGSRKSRTRVSGIPSTGSADPTGFLDSKQNTKKPPPYFFPLHEHTKDSTGDLNGETLFKGAFEQAQARIDQMHMTLNPLNKGRINSVDKGSQQYWGTHSKPAHVTTSKNQRAESDDDEKHERPQWRRVPKGVGKEEDDYDIEFDDERHARLAFPEDSHMLDDDDDDDDDDFNLRRRRSAPSYQEKSRPGAFPITEATHQLQARTLAVLQRDGLLPATIKHVPPVIQVTHKKAHAPSVTNRKDKMKLMMDLKLWRAHARPSSQHIVNKRRADVSNEDASAEILSSPANTTVEGAFADSSQDISSQSLSARTLKTVERTNAAITTLDPETSSKSSNSSHVTTTVTPQSQVTTVVPSTPHPVTTSSRVFTPQRRFPKPRGVVGMDDTTSLAPETTTMGVSYSRPTIRTPGVDEGKTTVATIAPVSSSTEISSPWPNSLAWGVTAGKTITSTLAPETSIVVSRPHLTALSSPAASTVLPTVPTEISLRTSTLRPKNLGSRVKPVKSSTSVPFPRTSSSTAESNLNQRGKIAFKPQVPNSPSRAHKITESPPANSSKETSERTTSTSLKPDVKAARKVVTTISPKIFSSKSLQASPTIVTPHTSTPVFTLTSAETLATITKTMADANFLNTEKVKTSGTSIKETQAPETIFPKKATREPPILVLTIPDSTTERTTATRRVPSVNATFQRPVSKQQAPARGKTVHIVGHNNSERMKRPNSWREVPWKLASASTSKLKILTPTPSKIPTTSTKAPHNPSNLEPIGDQKDSEDTTEVPEHDETDPDWEQHEDNGKVHDTGVSGTRHQAVISKPAYLLPKARPPMDWRKYPFYRAPTSEHLSTYSPLRYATNPFSVPLKTEGGMEFYESRDRTMRCESPKKPTNVIPERNEDGEWNERPQPEGPRMGNLGDAIGCMRKKLFGENPLDNPFFQETSVGLPQETSMVGVILDATGLPPAPMFDQFGFHRDILENIRSTSMLGPLAPMSAEVKNRPYIRVGADAFDSREAPSSPANVRVAYAVPRIPHHMQQPTALNGLRDTPLRIRLLQNELQASAESEEGEDKSSLQSGESIVDAEESQPVEYLVSHRSVVVPPPKSGIPSKVRDSQQSAKNFKFFKAIPTERLRFEDMKELYRQAPKDSEGIYDSRKKHARNSHALGSHPPNKDIFNTEAKDTQMMYVEALRNSKRLTDARKAQTEKDIQSSSEKVSKASVLPPGLLFREDVELSGKRQRKKLRKENRSDSDEKSAKLDKKMNSLEIGNKNVSPIPSRIPDTEDDLLDTSESADVVRSKAFKRPNSVPFFHEINHFSFYIPDFDGQAFDSSEKDKKKEVEKDNIGESSVSEERTELPENVSIQPTLNLRNSLVNQTKDSSRPLSMSSIAPIANNLSRASASSTGRMQEASSKRESSRVPRDEAEEGEVPDEASGMVPTAVSFEEFKRTLSPEELTFFTDGDGEEDELPLDDPEVDGEPRKETQGTKTVVVVRDPDEDDDDDEEFFKDDLSDLKFMEGLEEEPEENAEAPDDDENATDGKEHNAEADDDDDDDYEDNDMEDPHESERAAKPDAAESKLPPDSDGDDDDNDDIDKEIEKFMNSDLTDLDDDDDDDDSPSRKQNKDEMDEDESKTQTSVEEPPNIEDISEGEDGNDNQRRGSSEGKDEIENAPEGFEKTEDENATEADDADALLNRTKLQKFGEVASGKEGTGNEPNKKSKSIQNEASGGKLENPAPIQSTDGNRRRQRGDNKQRVNIIKNESKKNNTDSETLLEPTGYEEDGSAHKDEGNQASDQKHYYEDEEPHNRKRKMRRPRPKNSEREENPTTKIPLHALLVNIASSRKIFNGTAQTPVNFGGSPGVVNMAQGPQKHILPPHLLELPSKSSHPAPSPSAHSFDKLAPSASMSTPTLVSSAQSLSPVASFMLHQTPVASSFPPNQQSLLPPPLSLPPRPPSSSLQQNALAPPSQTATQSSLNQAGVPSHQWLPTATTTHPVPPRQYAPAPHPPYQPGNLLLLPQTQLPLPLAQPPSALTPAQQLLPQPQPPPPVTLLPLHQLPPQGQQAPPQQGQLPQPPSTAQRIPQPSAQQPPQQPLLAPQLQYQPQGQLQLPPLMQTPTRQLVAHHPPHPVAAYRGAGQPPPHPTLQVEPRQLLEAASSVVQQTQSHDRVPPASSPGPTTLPSTPTKLLVSVSTPAPLPSNIPVTASSSSPHLSATSDPQSAVMRIPRRKSG